MPKGHSTIGSQRALLKRMGTQRIGITITATDPDTGAKASIYVAGLTLGTLTQAQKDAFRDQLAGVLGVSPGLITLTFKSGSLIIGITINPSQIRTQSDNAFIVNAQAILSQLTNTTISNIITASGTSAVITGSPVIDPTKTTAIIEPTLQTISNLKYSIQTVNNPVVGHDTRSCIYTLLNSKIVRINKNGIVDVICNFPETTIKYIFITRGSSCLIIPSNNSGNNIKKVYIVAIPSGIVYINTTQIAFSPEEGFGFNKFNNRIYYASGGIGRYSTIEFSNITILSMLSGIPQSLSNSVTFSDVNTGYTISNNSIVKVNLTNNTFTTIAGGDSNLSYRQPGIWNNLPVTVPQINRWSPYHGSVYSPFADSSNGSHAWFSSISSSNLVIDSVNNILLVADTYSHRIRAIYLTNNNYTVITVAGTSPVFYDRAINDNTSTFTPEELASMGQVGAWDNPVSGMPPFNKVNSTYRLSTFNQPSNIALFNNAILVLDAAGTRILSNDYVNDLVVLSNKNVPTPLSSFGDVFVTFKISNAGNTPVTDTQLHALKTQFLSKYPFITPNNISLSLTNEPIIATLAYNPSLDINLFSKYELSTISNLASVFSDSKSILTNFKHAVTSTNLLSNFLFREDYNAPLIIGGFRYVTGIAVDSLGNIYVCDVPNMNPTGTNTSVVKKITPTGTITTIASGFDSPWALDVDYSGNVYVADTYNRLVKKISPSGSVTIIGSGFGQVTGIAVDSLDNIYVSDQENGIVKKINSAGNITTFTTGDELTGIHVDSSNNVYVCYGSSGILRKFAPNGTVMFTKVGFGNICDIAIDSSYNIYVTDSISNSVKKLTPSGSVTTFASNFTRLWGIVIDSSDNIYVSDYWNNQIKKFIPVNAVINDADITVNVNTDLVNECNEKVPQLNPLIMCFGPDKIYTTDLKNSILILDPNNGTTSILTTIPPIESYISRSLIFKGITADGRYLTVIDQYKFDESEINNYLSNYPTVIDEYKIDEPQSNNYLSNYVYRIDTSTGHCVKTIVFDRAIDIVNNTFYNKFTDTLYYTTGDISFQPVPYELTELYTVTIGTSTEIFPSRMTGALYLDKDTVCYIERDVIKKWNLINGSVTNVIGREHQRISTGGQFIYTSPVQFANVYPNLQFYSSYDSATDTLGIADNSAKCVILIKNVLNGVAFIDRIIGTPNTDALYSYPYTESKAKIFQDGTRITIPFVPNQAGKNSGISTDIVFTNPHYVHIMPGSAVIFVLHLDIAKFLSIYSYEDFWKCYTVSKIQGNIVAPFTLYNTSIPML